jgi:hypothetical protein
MKRVRHERLRFLDEAGATTILTRLYARAIGGERAFRIRAAQLREFDFDDFNNELSRRTSDDVD